MKNVLAWSLYTAFYILGGYYTYRHTEFFQDHPSRLLNLFWPIALMIDFAYRSEAFKKTND